MLTSVAGAQVPVPVGSGSFADRPPLSEGDGPQQMLSREIFVQPGEKRPIPTNDWWTDLLVSRFAGDLWAYPLVVSADEQGVRVAFPREWKADGGGLEMGERLRVGGSVVPEPNPSITALAGFDGADYGKNWLVQGPAFGTKPADGRIGGQGEVRGFLGNGLANSMHDGDGATGRLVSASFVLSRRYLHVLVGGGQHPGVACVNLVVDGKVVLSETGENSENLSWRTWDTAQWRGRNARIEIVDQVTGGWGHILADQLVASDEAKPPRGAGNVFQPEAARALRWGDWTLTFRMAQTPRQYIDVTLGRGLPYVWFEFTGVGPQFSVDEDAVLFDRAGKPLVLPARVDALIVEQAGAPFGVFLTPGSQVEKKGKILAVTPGPGPAVAVVVALPNRAALETFRASSFTIPRDSRMEWTYAPERAEVNTRWTLQTERLGGGVPTGLWQGWLPHHVRKTKHALKLDGPSFITPRGPLRTAFGTSFEMTFPFRGFAPGWPAPTDAGFDRARMAGYIEKFAERKDYGGDTYWGGKDLQLAGQYIGMARALQHPAEAKITDYLRGALTDWFTYTPGEPEHYFAAYTNWPALIGFNESYWSYQFTDNHFHYGYFTLASALLGAVDPAYLNGYGEMARRVGRQYANWDRTNADFPLLRTFDIWGGHSYAGGFGSPGGNNQESTSEAMQSWAGLFLLGQALPDKGMAAAGAMGYAMESQATLEYWFNQYGGNFSSNYPHSMVGILFNGGQAYATYFSGDPAWIHGIQWLPIGPHLDYLVEDAAWGREELHRTLRERKAKEGNDSITSMGAALGNVVLGFAALADPEWAITQMDELWKANDAVAHNGDVAGISYYLAHARRSLGPRRWDRFTVPPTGAVYEHEKNGTTVVVWNPRPYPELARVFGPSGEVGRFVARPQGLTAVHQLRPVSVGLGVVGLWPADGETNVSRFIDVFHLVFSGPVDAAALRGLVVRGPGVTGGRVTGGTNGTVAVAFEGRPQPGQWYEIEVPADALPGLSAPYQGRFRLEEQPPLAVTECVPARAASRVALDLKQVQLTFNARIDPASLSGVTLRGPGAPRMRPLGTRDGSTFVWELTGPLAADATYEVVVPTAQALTGEHLITPISIPFFTPAGPCPPVIYGDSFAGEGFSADGTLVVDWQHAERPFSGRHALRLQGGEKGGTLYLFRGTGDNGDRRMPMNATAYDEVELQACGTASSLWLKVGHPVFDQAFGQRRLEGITPVYQRFSIPLPQVRTNLNTLLAIGVEPGETLYVDDIRLVQKK